MHKTRSDLARKSTIALAVSIHAIRTPNGDVIGNLNVYVRAKLARVVEDIGVAFVRKTT